MKLLKSFFTNKHNSFSCGKEKFSRCANFHNLLRLFEIFGIHIPNTNIVTKDNFIANLTRALMKFTSFFLVILPISRIYQLSYYPEDFKVLLFEFIAFLCLYDLTPHGKI